MELTGRGLCNNFLSFLYGLLIENSVSRKFPVCGHVRGVIQGGNKPAGVSLTEVPSPDYPQNNHYPLFIHLSIVNPMVFYLSIHYPVIHG